MLLFLDFDGVRHPAPPHNRETGVLSHLERFESVIRDFPDWSIVISSSWREAFSLETIRGFFSSDVGGRIVGMTPVLNPDLPYLRQREIEQYVQDTGQTHVRWLALEDQAGEFGVGLPSLVLCNPTLGFDEQAEAALIACERNCKTAIVMVLKNLDAAEAKKRLDQHGGFIRQVLDKE